MIETFKQSQDFADISYMIDHISDIDARIDVLTKLGYRIGVSIIKPHHTVKNIVVGKNKKEVRMQITPKIGNINIAKCAVIEIKK